MVEFLQNLTNPDWIMTHGGLYVVLFIVFAETGLFVGFFLPGDSLLFITGMIIANIVAPGVSPVLNLIYWILLISAAGIIGNFVGYWFGLRSGNILLKRKDSLLFKKKYLHRAKEFYEQRGGWAIILARFLPIVRTFAPIVAGMVKMERKKFSFYNIVGSFAWVGSIVSIGFLLGENELVKEHMEKVILGIVIVPLVPVILKLVMGKKEEVQPIAVPIEKDSQESKSLNKE